MANQFIREYFVDPPVKGRVQFFRSLFVGAAATVADAGALILLKEFTPLSNHVLIAAAITYILGLVTNYLMSTFWAFRNLNTKKRSTEFIVFCVISTIGFGLNEAIIALFEYVLAPMLPQEGFIPQDKFYIIGKLVATVLVFIWNFGMRKILLYRGKKPADSNPS